MAITLTVPVLALHEQQWWVGLARAHTAQLPALSEGVGCSLRQDAALPAGVSVPH